MAKKTPAINSSSTADIAFLLLCYFLMTTTMGTNFGLSRQLPPMPTPDQEKQDQQINRRNLIQVRINSSDKIYAGGDAIDISMLKDKVKDFLTNPTNDPNLSEKEVKEIEGYSKGTYAVSKGGISLQNDRGTSYRAYIAVQNELVKAVNEIRDDFSMREYGKKYLQLEEDQQKVVKACIPQLISEAEPKDVGARRK